jgi:UDP-2,3-diacylglucosamine pyrophosphatase LpxH
MPPWQTRRSHFSGEVDMPDNSRWTVRLRSVFVSDVHLGSKGCRAEALLEFLKSVEIDYLYLVGDIVDLRAMRKSFFWPQEHNNVLSTVLGKAKGGTRVVYIPGNHDAELREFCGSVFGNLQIHREFVHHTADGRRLLVLHGDEFDTVVKCSPWLARLGSSAYDFLLRLNRYVNIVRRVLNLPYWSLASYLKHKTKTAVQYITSFEHAVAHAARKRGVEGVVCGHIHRPEISDIDGVQYCNDGDWVESCSALIEDMNGRLAIWSWPEARELLLREPMVEVAA